MKFVIPTISMCLSRLASNTWPVFKSFDYEKFKLFSYHGLAAYQRNGDLVDWSAFDRPKNIIISEIQSLGKNMTNVRAQSTFKSGPTVLENS